MYSYEMISKVLCEMKTVKQEVLYLVCHRLCKIGKKKMGRNMYISAHMSIKCLWKDIL